MKYDRENLYVKNVVAKQVDSSLWMAFVQLWPNLGDIGFWSIGNGENVNAWNDYWIVQGIIISNMNIKIPRES
jgi:hypothetical protein